MLLQYTRAYRIFPVLLVWRGTDAKQISKIVLRSNTLKFEYSVTYVLLANYCPTRALHSSQKVTSLSPRCWLWRSGRYMHCVLDITNFITLEMVGRQPEESDFDRQLEAIANNRGKVTEWMSVIFEENPEIVATAPKKSVKLCDIRTRETSYTFISKVSSSL